MKSSRKAPGNDITGGTREDEGTRSRKKNNKSENIPASQIKSNVKSWMRKQRKEQFDEGRR